MNELVDLFLKQKLALDLVRILLDAKLVGKIKADIHPVLPMLKRLETILKLYRRKPRITSGFSLKLTINLSKPPGCQPIADGKLMF